MRRWTWLVSITQTVRGEVPYLAFKLDFLFVRVGRIPFGEARLALAVLDQYKGEHHVDGSTVQGPPDANEAAYSTRYGTYSEYECYRVRCTQGCGDWHEPCVVRMYNISFVSTSIFPSLSTLAHKATLQQHYMVRFGRVFTLYGR